MTDELVDYDYTLPEELIARYPTSDRTGSRLMRVDRASGQISHHGFRDLPTLLSAGDRLVVNDTRVVPARVFGQRTLTGGRWEGLYLGTTPDGNWTMLASTRGKIREGETVDIAPAHPENAQRFGGPLKLQLELMKRNEDGLIEFRPSVDRPAHEILQFVGTMPLPPYMQRGKADNSDFERYQTIYGCVPGSVAAPTAGLHFTDELFSDCLAKGITRSQVTLHVGIGTFRPISVSRLADHLMHSEWCEVSAETAQAIQETRQTAGRVIAVGTTSVRTLESAAKNSESLVYQGETNLFIRPPFDFQVTGGLITNFHLPRSSLLVLISALASRELIQEAYRQAIKERYRFYSYGDAMLIV